MGWKQNRKGDFPLFLLKIAFLFTLRFQSSTLYEEKDYGTNLGRSEAGC